MPGQRWTCVDEQGSRVQLAKPAQLERPCLLAWYSPWGFDSAVRDEWMAFAAPACTRPHCPFLSEPCLGSIPTRAMRARASCGSHLILRVSRIGVSCVTTNILGALPVVICNPPAARVRKPLPHISHSVHGECHGLRCGMLFRARQLLEPHSGFALARHMIPDGFKLRPSAWSP